MLNNGCNDFLFGVHCVEEGDRIPPNYYYYYFYAQGISDTEGEEKIV